MPVVLLKLEVVVNVFIWNILSTEKDFLKEFIFPDGGQWTRHPVGVYAGQNMTSNIWL